MKTKKPAVQATAPAPIGADHIRDFLGLLPKQTQILGTKVHRNAGKSEIRVVYIENGKINIAYCSFIQIIDDSVSAEIETLSAIWKGGAA